MPRDKSVRFAHNMQSNWIPFCVLCIEKIKIMRYNGDESYRKERMDEKYFQSFLGDLCEYNDFWDFCHFMLEGY